MGELLAPTHMIVVAFTAFVLPKRPLVWSRRSRRDTGSARWISGRSRRRRPVSLERRRDTVAICRTADKQECQWSAHWSLN